VSCARVCADSPLPGPVQQAERRAGGLCGLQHSLLGEVGLPDGAIAVGDLLACLRLQRLVHDVQQFVVLPQADAEGDREHGHADDQAGSELFQMVDEAQLLLVADHADRGSHWPY
jgi:hypothetical protein